MISLRLTRIKQVALQYGEFADPPGFAAELSYPNADSCAIQMVANLPDDAKEESVEMFCHLPCAGNPDFERLWSPQPGDPATDGIVDWRGYRFKQRPNDCARNILINIVKYCSN